MTSTLQHLDRATFLAAARRADIDEVAAQALWHELTVAAAVTAQPARERTGFPRLVAILVALGSLLVLGAGSLWVAIFDDALNYVPVLVMAAGALSVCVVAAVRLRRREQGDLASWFAALAITLVPVTIAAVGQVLGIDAESANGHDAKSVVTSALSMIGAVAVFARCRTPLAFLATIALTAWAAATALTAAFDQTTGDTHDAQVLFGLGVAGLALGTVLDLRSLRRFGFWPHLLGSVAAITVGAVTLPGAWWLAMILVGAAVAALGVFLARSLLLGIGAASAWIGVVAIEPNPFTLIISGLVTIALGIWLARDGNPLRTWIEERQARL